MKTKTMTRRKGPETCHLGHEAVEYWMANPRTYVVSCVERRHITVEAPTKALALAEWRRIREALRKEEPR